MHFNQEQTRQTTSYYKKYKRAVGILLCLVALPAVLLIILLFALLVSLESPGNPFYLQERVGLNGKKFYIYKLRSMGVDAEKDGHQWASSTDHRITKVGRFIRLTRIDELPQIFNILKGDMNIIGPRPERDVFIQEFLVDIPNFNERLAIRPGITGWAQVNGGYDLSPKEKLSYDLYYIENESLKLDVLILFKTIKIIFTGEGAR